MGAKSDDAITVQAMQKLALKGMAGVDIDAALWPVLRNSPDFIAWMAAVTPSSPPALRRSVFRPTQASQRCSPNSTRTQR
jgi:hypothetical protein